MGERLSAAYVESLHAEVEALYNLMGDWTDNTQVRQTGLSLHVKWEDKLDVLRESTRLRALFLNAPVKYLVTLDALRQALEVLEANGLDIPGLTSPASPVSREGEQ